MDLSGFGRPGVEAHSAPIIAGSAALCWQNASFQTNFGKYDAQRIDNDFSGRLGSVVAVVVDGTAANAVEPAKRFGSAHDGSVCAG